MARVHDGRPTAGILIPPWKSIQDAGTLSNGVKRTSVVDDPILGAARKVVKHTVYNIDVSPYTPTSNPRAQVVSHNFIDEGDTYFYGYSILLPSSFPAAKTTTGSNWLALGSVYGRPFAGSSNSGLGGIQCRNPASDSFHSMTVNKPVYKRLWSMPVVLGKWVDFVVEMCFSADPARGFKRLWVNTGSGWQRQKLDGQDTYYMQTRTTANDDEPNFVKFSHYRRVDMFDVATTYHTGTVVATTFDEADPKSYSTTSAPPTGAPTKAATPTSTVSDNDITVSWAANPAGDNVTAYRVYRVVGTGGETKIYDGTALTYTDTNQSAGSTQKYTVAAVNASGEGARSDPLTVTLPTFLADLNTLDDNAPRTAVSLTTWPERMGNPATVEADQIVLPPTSEIKTDRRYRTAGRRFIVGPYTLAARDIGTADLSKLRLSILSTDNNARRISLRYRHIGTNDPFLQLQYYFDTSDINPTTLTYPTGSPIYLSLSISDDGTQAIAEWSPNGVDTWTILGTRDVTALNLSSTAAKVAVATDYIGGDGTMTPARITRIRGADRAVAGLPPSISNILGPNSAINPFFTFDYAGDPATIFRWNLTYVTEEEEPIVSPWTDIAPETRSVKAGTDLVPGTYIWTLEAANASGSVSYTKEWTVARRPAPIAPVQSGRGGQSLSFSWSDPPAEFMVGDTWQIYINGQPIALTIQADARTYTYSNPNLVDNVPVDVQMSYGSAGNYSEFSDSVPMTPGVVSNTAVTFTTTPATVEVSSGGSTAIKTVKLALQATGTGVPQFTITDNAPWMVVTPTTGTAPAELTVTLDPAGLTLGDHDGSITISHTP